MYTELQLSPKGSRAIKKKQDNNKNNNKKHLDSVYIVVQGAKMSDSAPFHDAYTCTDQTSAVLT